MSRVNIARASINIMASACYFYNTKGSGAWGPVGPLPLTLSLTEREDNNIDRHATHVRLPYHRGYCYTK